MAKIVLDNVVVQYPLYTTTRQRSLLGVVANKASFGRVARDAGAIPTVAAIRGVSFSLKDGDRLAIVGRNGSGKTTMLKLLSGLVPPDSGRLQIVGSRASIINLGAGLDPDKTGIENVMMVASFLGVKRSERDALLEDVAEFTELGEFLDLPIRTYSSGMGVRLIFALTTAIERDILIVDEVIGAGDALFVEKAANRIRRMFDRAKILVLATHSGEIAAQLCNRCLWMAQGEALAEGAPDQIWQMYLQAGAPPPAVAAE